MLVCNPFEITIQGITNKGKTFRPSDWAERLCGVLSSFDHGHRLSYHEWVRPILVDNVRCVAIDRQLERINEAMFRFLMDFAHDNDLRIIDKQSFPAVTLDVTAPLESSLTKVAASATLDAGAGSVANAASVEVVKTPVTLPVARHVAAHEMSLCYAATCWLSEKINGEALDLDAFVERSSRMIENGFLLAGVFEEGKANALAFCFCHVVETLSGGRYLDVHDLGVKSENDMAALALWLQETAKNEACHAIRCTVSNAATTKNTRRLLALSGFDIAAQGYVLT